MAQNVCFRVGATPTFLLKSMFEIMIRIRENKPLMEKIKDGQVVFSGCYLESFDHSSIKATEYLHWKA